MISHVEMISARELYDCFVTFCHYWQSRAFVNFCQIYQKHCCTVMNDKNRRRFCRFFGTFCHQLSQCTISSSRESKCSILSKLSRNVSLTFNADWWISSTDDTARFNALTLDCILFELLSAVTLDKKYLVWFLVNPHFPANFCTLEAMTDSNWS